MALLSGVPWLFTVLFWTCICFPPQKGSSFAHGSPLHDDAVSSHADMLYPGNSNQITTEASLSTNHNFDSHHFEVHHNNDISDTAENLGEELPVPPTTKDERGQLSAVSSVKNEDSSSQHPFGLLVKEHTQPTDMDGVTFPTIRDLKRFINRMKSSFLTPGSDLSKHFETARDIMVQRLATNAGNTESHTGEESDPANQENAHHEATVREAWSGPMNEVFEQSDGTLNYQIPNESPSDLYNADPTSSFVSHNAAVHQHHPSEASQFDNEQSFNREETYMRTPDLQHFDVFSSSSEQILSDSSNPSLDFGYFSSASLEKPIQPLDHKGYRITLAGFEPGEELQIVDVGRDTDFVSAPEHQSLGSYGKSLHVSPPRSQLHVQDYAPKQERPVPTLPVYKPTAVQEANYIEYISTLHQPPPLGSVSSSESPPPQSLSSHVSSETSVPRYISVKPFSIYQDGYRGERRLGHPSINHVQVKEEEESKPAQQDLISAAQESDEMSNNIRSLFSHGSDSTQSQISSQVGVAYASFSSLTGPNPASETSFSRAAGEEFTSESSGVPGENIHRFTTFDFHGTQRPPRLPVLRRPDLFLNGDFMNAIRASHQQSLNRLPLFLNKEHSSLAFQHPKLLSVPGISASNRLLWGGNIKTRSPPPQTALIMPPPVQTYVVKSTNGYVRGKVSRSKTRYDPYQPNPSRYNRGDHGNVNIKAQQASA